MGTVRAGWGAQPDQDELAAAFGNGGFELEQPVAVTATVLDTFDGRLHAAGLRLHHDGHTLVLGGAGTVPARLDLGAAPRFPADLPPGPLRARLLDIVEVRALLPLAAVSAVVRHSASRNAEGKVVSSVRTYEQISTDRGSVDGWLVEVDELTGYEKQASRTTELIAATGAVLTDDDAIALLLRAAGVDPTGHHDEPTVPLDADLPALEGFRLVLANLQAAVDANLPGTIRDIDPEFLHDLRVAVRRSRSVLRHGKRVLPADVVAWSHPDLKHLGDITGPPRDLDVLAEEWDGYVAALPDNAAAALAPVRAQLDEDRAAAHRQLATDLVSEHVVDLLDRWRAWLATGAGTPGPRGERRLVDVVVRRIEKAEGRLIDHGRAITPETPAEDVHEVRKDAKRLRYLLECFGSLLAEDRAQGVRQALEGAPGQPRRAPGRRGPRRHAADDGRRAAGDDCGGDARRRRPVGRAARTAARRGA